MTSRLTVMLFLTSINLYGQLDKKVYDVYSTVIKEAFVLEEDTVHSLVLIYKGTAGQKIFATIDVAVESSKAIQGGQPVFLQYADNIIVAIEKFPQIGQLIVELKRNNKNSKLRREFDLNCKYNLITKRKFEKLVKNNRLNKLQEKDSRLFGMIEFSNVAFDGDYAAVCCGLYLGAYSFGTLLILKKEGNKWRIISRPQIWGS